MEVAIFLISFVFSFSHPLMAYKIPKGAIINTEKEEPNYKQEKGITLTATLIWLAKVVGTAIISFVAKVILNIGLRAACKKYINHNDAWDYVCNSVSHGRE